MKRASGVIVFLILLIAALGAVFVLGYSPMHVPHDSVGVIVSKTSGVSEKPVEAGKFQWNWQLLIPTNAKIRSFSAKPYTYSKVKSGELPGAEIYSSLFNDKPSFKYSMTFNFELKCDSNEFVNLVKNSDISSDSDLKAKYESCAEEIVSKILDKIFTQFTNDDDNKLIDIEAVKNDIVKEYDGTFSVVSLNISDVKIPDVAVYKNARKMYSKHMSEIEAELEKLTSIQAKEISDNTKSISKLEKFGKVIKDNPELAELLKSSKDLSDTLKTIYEYN